MDNGAHRPKASRDKILEAIKSGQYVTTMPDGMVVTDFNAIEALFGKYASASHARTKALRDAGSKLSRLIKRDGLKCSSCKRNCDPGADPNSELFPTLRKIIPTKDGGKSVMTNILIVCNRCRHGGAVKPAQEVTPIILHRWKLKRLEHFGDAIVLLAARLLCDVVVSFDNHAAYHCLCHKLVTNKNYLTNPIIQYEDQFEEIIGEVLVTDGVEPALDLAKQMLRETKAFKDHALTRSS